MVKILGTNSIGARERDNLVVLNQTTMPAVIVEVGCMSDAKELKELKKKLGTSCMKDFNFHTAHIKYTVGKTLVDMLGEAGEKAVELALKDYVDTFGQEYLDVLDGLYPVE